MKQYIEEYLYSIVPDIDLTQWDNAVSSIEGKLQKLGAKKFESPSEMVMNKLQNATKDYRDATKAFEELTQREERIKQALKSDDYSSVVDLLPDKFKTSKAENKTDKQDGTKDTTIDIVPSINKDVNADDIKSYLETELKNTTADKNIAKFNKESAGKFAGFIAGISSAASAAMGVATIFIQVIKVAKEVYDKAVEIADKAAELGNTWVSSSSINPDETIRQYMMNFGASATQAKSIDAAFNAMGIQTSDLATLTEGQRDVLQQLIEKYDDALNSLDPDKVDRFTEATNRYQLTVMESRLKIQATMEKFLTQSDAIPKLLENVGDIAENIADILASPVVQFGMNAIMHILNGIVWFINQLTEAASLLFGGNVTYNTNNSTSYNTNSATYYMNDSSNSALTSSQMTSSFNV